MFRQNPVSIGVRTVLGRIAMEAHLRAVQQQQAAQPAQSAPQPSPGLSTAQPQKEPVGT